MLKEPLREQGIQFLKTLEKNPLEKKQKETIIHQRLFSTNAWQEAESVGVILSLPFELDTEPIFAKALEEHKIVTVPKTFPKRQMKFFQVDEASLFEESVFGVKEPKGAIERAKEQIDLILVPGIIFSSHGYRIDRRLTAPSRPPFRTFSRWSSLLYLFSSGVRLVFFVGSYVQS